jgi:hypothetical protein
MVGSSAAAAADVAAEAHPSNYETLTLDFLIGGDGLKWIDVAVVPGTSYEPFATVEAKSDIARRILATLNVPVDDVSINPMLSALYHEAGFLITFKQPGLGFSSDLRINSTGIQRIAKDAGTRLLRLDICGAAESPGSSDIDVLSGLDIDAKRPPNRPPDGFEDRGACKVWTMTTTEYAASITVRAESLPRTGADGVAAAVFAGLTAIAIGVAMLFLGAHTASTGGRRSGS